MSGTNSDPTNGNATPDMLANLGQFSQITMPNINTYSNPLQALNNAGSDPSAANYLMNAGLQGIVAGQERGPGGFLRYGPGAAGPVAAGLLGAQNTSIAMAKARQELTGAQQDLQLKSLQMPMRIQALNLMQQEINGTQQGASGVGASAIFGQRGNNTSQTVNTNVPGQTSAPLLNYIHRVEGSGENPLWPIAKGGPDGPYQFTASTWTNWANNHPEITAGMTPQQVLALRRDPNIAANATLWLAGQNGQFLAAHGVDPTPANIVLAHHLGPAGALKVATADPNTPIEQLMPGVSPQNPDLAGKTAGQIAHMYDDAPGITDSTHPTVAGGQGSLGTLSAHVGTTPEQMIAVADQHARHAMIMQMAGLNGDVPQHIAEQLYSTALGMMKDRAAPRDVRKGGWVVDGDGNAIFAAPEVINGVGPGGAPTQSYRLPPGAPNGQGIPMMPPAQPLAPSYAPAGPPAAPPQLQAGAGSDHLALANLAGPMAAQAQQPGGAVAPPQPTGLGIIPPANAAPVPGGMVPPMAAPGGLGGQQQSPMGGQLPGLGSGMAGGPSIPPRPPVQGAVPFNVGNPAGPTVSPAVDPNAVRNVSVGPSAPLGTPPGTASVPITGRRLPPLPNGPAAPQQLPDGAWATGLAPGQKMSIEKQQELFRSEPEVKKYEGAQQTLGMVNEMDHSFNVLNSTAGWQNTGAGAELKQDTAQVLRSVGGMFGVDFSPDFDSKLTAAQDLEKNTTRLGMMLTSSNFGGSREAASIINGAIKANPGLANTPQAATLLLNSIKEAAQRQVDKRVYMNTYQQRTNGDLGTADTDFDQAMPPQAYSRRALSKVDPIRVQQPSDLNQLLPGTWYVRPGDNTPRQLVGNGGQ